MVRLSQEERTKRIKQRMQEISSLDSLHKVEKRLQTYYFYNELTQNLQYAYYRTQYTRYLSFLKSSKRAVRNHSLDNLMNLPRGTSNRYINKKSKPHLFLLANSIPSRSTRRGYRWLPLRNKMHHQPIDFIEVPLEIQSYEDILSVLQQLHPRSPHHHLDKEEAFGYVLGMILSDTSKPEGYSNSHQCLVSLTRKYQWSVDIGDNFCRYLQALGIYAHRIKDNGKLRIRAPSGEYRWISEKSPFFSWILKSCFGFSKSQRTTFDKVHADWMLRSSYTFRRSFLQGLCDGDGSAHNFWRVEISCAPNQEFVVLLLQTFGVKAYIDKDAVSVAHLNSLVACDRLPLFKYAYGRLDKLWKVAAMIQNRRVQRYSDKLKGEIISLKRKNYSGGQISEYLFDTQSIGIKPEAINHIYRKNLLPSK